MSGSALRTLLTILVNVLIAAAVVLAIRLFVVFTGQIAAQSWARAYVALTHNLVIPFDARAVKTPYHGFFEVDTALTIGVALIAEWGLSAVRDRA